MWLEIFIAVLVVCFYLQKSKEATKIQPILVHRGPWPRLQEEEITTKVVALDAEIEIIQKSPAAEEKSNDSQQASKKDAVDCKKQDPGN